MPLSVHGTGLSPEHIPEGAPEKLKNGEAKSKLKCPMGE
jgi:hypothetical protein